MALAMPGAGAPPASPDTAGVYVHEQALRAYAQGRLSEAQGDLREALGAYIRAFTLDRGALPIARRVAELAYRLGDPSSASEFADKALALDPADATALWVKGSALLEGGHAAEALPQLLACVTADSSNAEYLQTLAHAAEAVDRTDIVARAYGRAVELDEDDGENWFQLAAAQVRLGQFEEAAKSLERVSELSPARPGQIFLQGFVDEHLGRPDSAIVLYRSHLTLHRNDQLTRQRLVGLLARQHRWDEALSEAHVVAHALPGDWEALAVVAELALAAGRAGEARPALSALEGMAEPDPDRIGRLAAMLVRNQRKRDGIRLAETWASRHASDPRGSLLVARINALAGEREAAVPYARRAVEAQPDSLLPRVTLARLYADGKHFEDAERVLREGLDRHPGTVPLLLELGGVREERGNLPGAEGAVREALARDPENPQALNSLGYLLADQNRDLDAAEGMIQRAVERDPDNGAFIDSLGWVYYRLGRIAEARKQLERAVELTGGDPVVREHLGDVYRDLRMNGQAREQYRQSLARDATNARVRAKLEALRP